MHTIVTHSHVVRVCSALIMGKPFWATQLSAFPWAPRSSYFTLFEDMDQQSQADAVALGTARLLDILPKAPTPRVWSERSVTWQKQSETTAQLALLTRDDGTPSSLRECSPQRKWDAMVCRSLRCSEIELTHLVSMVRDNMLVWLLCRHVVEPVRAAPTHRGAAAYAPSVR